MNNKNKGTTLIEIMVSVMLISFVMILLFNILIKVKEEYNLASKRSADAISRATYTRIIQNDLINYGLKGIASCSNGLFCLRFTLDNNQVRYLILEDSKTISYGDSSNKEKWELTLGTYNKNDIRFTYNVATTNNSLLNSNSSVVNYHLFKLIIPVSSDVTSNKKFDLEITHVGNKALSLNCSSLPSYVRTNSAYYCINAVR